MKVLRSIDHAIAKVEGWLIIIFLALMVSLTFSQVMLRALFTHAQFQWANFILGHVDWSEPLARLLVLWITFLGASLLTRENKHIKIDLLPAVIPPKWLPYRELILSIGCVVICAFMLKASIGYIKLELDFGGYLFLKLPAWVGQLILPAGFLMILFRFLIRGMEQLLEIFRGSRT